MAANLSTRLKRLAFRGHQFFAILGGLALLLWGGSGLLHPLMTALGPQPAVFLPPMQPVDLQGTRPITQTLEAAGIAQAEAIRLVPSPAGQLWQVTVGQDQPRRYFHPESGAELPAHDPAQAVWLARHWLAQPHTPVKSVVLVDRFSPDYPAVNRLLPVWRVEFARADGLSAMIYTETGAVAAVNNHWKSRVQRWFQWLHTWSFLPQKAEWARAILIAALVGSLFLMAASGTGLLLSIRHRKRLKGLKGWHRAAAYALALPVLALSSSGLFHLVQNVGSEPVRVLRLSPAVSPSAGFGLESQWASLADGLGIAGVSLVETNDGRPLYRLALQPPRQGAPYTPGEIRNARFDGIQPSGPALYLDAATGKAWGPGDLELALQLGERFTGVPRTAIRARQLVTRFGPAYDFRNKRLPVWRLDYGPPTNASLFVDTATGVLADTTPNRAKAELWSFSMLHKWNFLLMFGREAQTLIVSLTVALTLLLMGGAGLQMEWKRRRRLRRI